MNQSYKINLATLARILLGLFALGCVIILLYFLPKWHAMEPEVFLRWFSENGKTIGMIMLPLEMAPLVMCVVLLVRRRHDLSGERYGLAVNGSNLLILILFVLFFLPANKTLMDVNTNSARVSSILSDWKVFHTVRTILAIASFALSLFAFRRTEVSRARIEHVV